MCLYSAYRQAGAEYSQQDVKQQLMTVDSTSACVPGIDPSTRATVTARLRYCCSAYTVTVITGVCMHGVLLLNRLRRRYNGVRGNDVNTPTSTTATTSCCPTRYPLFSRLARHDDVYGVLLKFEM